MGDYKAGERESADNLRDVFAYVDPSSRAVERFKFRGPGPIIQGCFISPSLIVTIFFSTLRTGNVLLNTRMEPVCRISEREIRTRFG